MKDIIKFLLAFLLAFLFGGVGAAIPITGFYLLWSWCMAQVPVALAWAGLAKIAITLGMVAVGGGTTVGLAILAGVGGATLAVLLVEVCGG